MTFNLRHRRALRLGLAAVIFGAVLAPVTPASAEGGDHTVTGTGCTSWSGTSRAPIPFVYAQVLPWTDTACLNIDASTAGEGAGTAQVVAIETPVLDEYAIVPEIYDEGETDLLNLELDCVEVEESPTEHTIFASGLDANSDRAWVAVTEDGFYVTEYADRFTPCGAAEFTMPAASGGYSIDHVAPSPNSFPTADFEATCVGLTCTFDAGTSTDSDGEVVRYRWWVDRNWRHDAPQSKHGGESFSITLQQANLLGVKLLVTDDGGRTNTITKQINVGLPVSKHATPSCNGLTCTFDASASFDPDGTVVHYYWNIDLRVYANGPSPEFTYTFTSEGTHNIGVRVEDNDGNVSPWMDWIEVELSATPTAPAAPSSLTATAESSSAITLDWTDVRGESGYKIQRSPDGTTWAQVATAPADSITYTDAGLNPSTTYHYRVIASNDVGDSTASPVATATTLADTIPPSAPSDLVAMSGRGRITLTWGAAEDDVGGSGVAGYSIYRSTDGPGGSFTLLAADVTGTSYEDHPVKNGKTYSYYVVAVDRAGNTSPPSNVATA